MSNVSTIICCATCDKDVIRIDDAYAMNHIDPAGIIAAYCGEHAAA